MWRNTYNESDLPVSAAYDVSWILHLLAVIALSYAVVAHVVTVYYHKRAVSKATAEGWVTGEPVTSSYYHSPYPPSAYPFTPLPETTDGSHLLSPGHAAVLPRPHQRAKHASSTEDGSGSVMYINGAEL